jgi:ABC-2 type transport system permease protein
VRKAFAVGRKEFHQIVRDRRSLATLLIFPAFVLLLFGYALNWDVRHIKLAVDDRDRSAESRALISAFVNSGYFDLVAIVDSDAELTRLMDRNDARAVLVIPPAFEEDLQRQTPVPVQLLLNGDNANTATTVMGYALTIVQSEASRREPATGSSRHPPITVEARIWYNPQLRSTLFLVPGLIAYISMISAVVSTALSIVRERERDHQQCGWLHSERSLRARQTFTSSSRSRQRWRRIRGDGVVRTAVNGSWLPCSRQWRCS